MEWSAAAAVSSGLDKTVKSQAETERIDYFDLGDIETWLVFVRLACLSTSKQARRAIALFNLRSWKRNTR
jgi:hypothetical protein